MCTDTPQRYLRRILVSDFKQTKRWPIIPSLRRCQCSPPPAYLSMCTDIPQRYLRRILILDSNKKTLAVRSHFKIGSHFCGNPVHTSYLCAATLPGYLRKLQQGFKTPTAYLTLWTLVVRPTIILWTLVVSYKTYLMLVVSYGACKNALDVSRFLRGLQNVLDVSRLLRGL